MSCQWLQTINWISKLNLIRSVTEWIIHFHIHIHSHEGKLGWISIFSVNSSLKLQHKARLGIQCHMDHFYCVLYEAWQILLQCIEQSNCFFSFCIQYWFSNAWSCRICDRISSLKTSQSVIYAWAHFFWLFMRSHHNAADLQVLNFYGLQMTSKWILDGAKSPSI